VKHGATSFQVVMMMAIGSGVMALVLEQVITGLVI
jgi:hypothetical protein